MQLIFEAEAKERFNTDV